MAAIRVRFILSAWPLAEGLYAVVLTLWICKSLHIDLKSVFSNFDPGPIPIVNGSQILKRIHSLQPLQWFLHSGMAKVYTLTICVAI